MPAIDTIKPSADYDIFIIGGGINGVGIARDAAGRGLKTGLAEMNDLASATSSWSTKLIHGGLRYLEHYEFKLVRESLIEREILLNAAPHLIEPLRFVLPHHRGLRPAWLLRLGLFLYDHIGGRRLLEASRKVDLSQGPLGAPLKAAFKKGFEYSDCRADDARLVVLNAVDAAARGADICVQTRFVRAEPAAGGWTVHLESNGKHRTISAKTLVNAAGPWVTSVFDCIEAATPTKGLRLVKGSHIITKKLFEHDRAYIFQHGDGRIVFAIPYRNDLTLIGTTDEPYDGDPAKVAICDAEISYLCGAVSEYFETPVRPADIVSTYSGVRPLFDDLSKGSASKITRDYAFDLQMAQGKAPLLSLYGGKLTTYRKLAVDALRTLAPHLPNMGPIWTDKASLPGGETGFKGLQALKDGTAQRYPYLPDAMRERLLKAYGSRISLVLGEAQSLDDLGTHFGADLYAAELEYMRAHEWTRTSEDALTRRSKLSLALTPDQQAGVAAWFDAAGDTHTKKP
jgi:glycerol-3-phosphate dehydrogenase